MTGPDGPMQRVGEKQVARILQRAAALQERGRQRGSLSSEISRGVSLAELKQIAGEVGIAPRYVEAAAAELERGDRARGRFMFWGAPASTELEQTVEAELPAEEWEELVARIRRRTGNLGRTSTLGQSLEWTGEHDHVSISRREGRTTIRILSQHADSTAAPHALAFLGCSLAILPIIVWLHTVPLEAASFSAVAAGGFFSLARVWAGAMFRGRREKMEELLQELADHTTQAAAGCSAEPARLRLGQVSEALAGSEHSLGVSEQP